MKDCFGLKAKVEKLQETHIASEGIFSIVISSFTIENINEIYKYSGDLPVSCHYDAPSGLYDFLYMKI